jgi:hypothetical protein
MLLRNWTHWLGNTIYNGQIWEEIILLYTWWQKQSSSQTWSEEERRHTNFKITDIFIMSYFTPPYILLLLRGFIPSWVRSVSAINKLALRSIPIFLRATFHDMLNIYMSATYICVGRVTQEERSIFCEVIHSSMAIQPFVGPWPLFQFRNVFYTDGRIPWTGISSSHVR